MKVLILHQHFNTPQRGGALRSYYLAKALVDSGIQTTVITGHGLPVEKVEVIEGITVHYLPNPYDNRFGFYKRGYSFARYILQSVRVARHYQDADVCYAISTPLTIGLAARWIKRLYGIPYVFEVGDLWPDAPVQLGIIRSPLLKRTLYKLEKRIYKGAASLVALSLPIADAMRQRVSGKTIHIIPNMADTTYFRPTEKSAALILLFFPQMKPEQVAAGFSEKDFEAVGVRPELIPILQKLGIQSVEQMKEMKASKLFNDVCGTRKKMKLENVQNPTLQEVENWLNKTA